MREEQLTVVDTHAHTRTHSHRPVPHLPPKSILFLILTNLANSVRQGEREGMRFLVCGPYEGVNRHCFSPHSCPCSAPAPLNLLPFLTASRPAPFTSTFDPAPAFLSHALTPIPHAYLHYFSHSLHTVHMLLRRADRSAKKMGYFQNQRPGCDIGLLQTETLSSWSVSRVMRTLRKRKKGRTQSHRAAYPASKG